MHLVRMCCPQNHEPIQIGLQEDGQDGGLSGLTPPILLPNKDNYTVLALTENYPRYGDVAWHAISVPDGGGVKATTLAGGIFNHNHKDSKKGHHDTYCAALDSHTGSHTVFANVSNT